MLYAFIKMIRRSEGVVVVQDFIGVSPEFCGP
jgi:hypothetical protein